jgi:hypothetical protein
MKVIISKLFENDKKNYNLQAYTIMPDHFYITTKPYGDNTLSML